MKQINTRLSKTKDVRSVLSDLERVIEERADIKVVNQVKLVLIKRIIGL